MRVKAEHGWWVSHAQAPTVLPLGDRHWRIYFAARDRNNRSRILAVDIDPADGMRVTAEHLEPLVELGPPGSFDHMGTGPTSVIVVDGQVRLYYFGVSLRHEVRGAAAIGLAISDDGLNFRRAFEGPVLGLGPLDPFLSTAAFVRPARGGFRMWYVGGTEWRRSGEQLEPIYEIRMARSADGLFWDPRTETAVALAAPDDAGLGRPWIAATSRGERLWLSRRGEAFRAGGPDAYQIVELPLGLDGRIGSQPKPLRFANPPGPDDFDSWMQAYACVMQHGDDLIMLYNGNDFGCEGFGWATSTGGGAIGQ